MRVFRVVSSGFRVVLTPPSLRHQAIVVFHANWIAKVIQENFTVSLTKYVLDDRYEEPSDNSLHDARRSSAGSVTKLLTPTSSDTDPDTTLRGDLESEHSTCSSVASRRQSVLKRKIASDAQDQDDCISQAAKRPCLSGATDPLQPLVLPKNANANANDETTAPLGNQSRFSPTASTRASRPFPPEFTTARAISSCTQSKRVNPLKNVRTKAEKDREGNVLWRKLFGNQPPRSRPASSKLKIEKCDTDMLSVRPKLCQSRKSGTTTEAEGLELQVPQIPRAHGIRSEAEDLGSGVAAPPHSKLSKLLTSSETSTIRMSVKDALEWLKDSDMKVPVVFEPGERYRGKKFVLER
ncbi:hypothetical protein NEOLEDRAFT_805698 [Neolentinus lepideus HHB14362 ss-1]|uniref:Uncharacterized protein n=1 Tax=Neolentinus lepideus HHB14362 ss-1 TaxID=1314782 RepID=A0A165PFQ2_9AGAM|nr:hypothetical protein NEOLEDRAFT_805698 [Neolentinus lepideus HHB14362 ss-1]